MKIDRPLLFIILLYISLCFFVLVLQIFSPSKDFFIDGLFITDTITIYNHLEEIARGNIADFIEVRGNGVKFLYLPLYLISGKLIFIQNIVMGITTIYFLYNTFERKISSITSSLCFAVFPYTLLCVGGPNKEIPLIFFTVLFFYKKILRKNFFYHILIIFHLVLVRDGYGLLFFIIWIINLILEEKKASKILSIYLPISIIIVYSLLGNLILIFSYFQQFSENSQWLAYEMSQKAESSITEFSTSAVLEYQNSPLIQSGLFLYRILANIFSQLIRPFIFTKSGSLYLNGLSFYITGLICAVSFWNFFMRKNLSQSSNEKILSSSITFLLVGSSYSIFIQQRYLYPFLPLLFGLIATIGYHNLIKQFLSFFIFSIVLYLFLTYFISLPKLEVEPNLFEQKPKYIIQ